MESHRATTSIGWGKSARYAIMATTILPAVERDHGNLPQDTIAAEDAGRKFEPPSLGRNVSTHHGSTA